MAKINPKNVREENARLGTIKDLREGQSGYTYPGVITLDADNDVFIWNYLVDFHYVYARPSKNAVIHNHEKTDTYMSNGRTKEVITKPDTWGEATMKITRKGGSYSIDISLCADYTWEKLPTKMRHALLGKYRDEKWMYYSRVSEVVGSSD